MAAGSDDTEGAAARPPAVDLLFGLAVLALAAVVWWGAASLPPPRYEPLGSAALPRGLAVAMAGLALVVIVRAVLRRPAVTGQAVVSERAAASDAGFRRRPGRAAGAFALLVAYVLVLDLGLASFVPASCVAFILIGGVLTGFEWRRLPWLAGFVILLVIALQLVFTRIFYIDLP